MHVCGMCPNAAAPKWVCIRKKLDHRFALSVRQLAFGNLFTFWYGLRSRSDMGSTWRAVKGAQLEGGVEWGTAQAGG